MLKNDIELWFVPSIFKVDVSKEIIFLFKVLIYNSIQLCCDL